MISEVKCMSVQDNARKLISKIIEATQTMTVAAGDIFAWGAKAQMMGVANIVL